MNPQNPRHPTVNYNEYGAQILSPTISLNLHHTVWLLGPESKNPPHLFFPQSFLTVVAEVSYSQNKNNRGQSSHSISSAPGNVSRAHHK